LVPGTVGIWRRTRQNSAMLLSVGAQQVPFISPRGIVNVQASPLALPLQASNAAGGGPCG